MNRKSLWIGGSILALTVVSGLAVSGQDRYTLKLPGGVAFSDFKGYGDWQLISSAETGDRMKVILGNPTIIAAFKAGIPGNGKPFPEGSKIAKVDADKGQSVGLRYESPSTTESSFRNLSNCNSPASVCVISRQLPRSTILQRAA
jgi:hypothetical protein